MKMAEVEPVPSRDVTVANLATHSSIFFQLCFTVSFIFLSFRRILFFNPLSKCVRYHFHILFFSSPFFRTVTHIFKLCHIFSSCVTYFPNSFLNYASNYFLHVICQDPLFSTCATSFPTVPHLFQLLHIFCNFILYLYHKLLST